MTYLLAITPCPSGSQEQLRLVSSGGRDLKLLKNGARVTLGDGDNRVVFGNEAPKSDIVFNRPNITGLGPINIAQIDGKLVVTDGLESVEVIRDRGHGNYGPTVDELTNYGESSGYILGRGDVLKFPPGHTENPAYLQILEHA